jgi:hypothetical protein
MKKIGLRPGTGKNTHADPNGILSGNSDDANAGTSLGRCNGGNGCMIHHWINIEKCVLWFLEQERRLFASYLKLR